MIAIMLWSLLCIPSEQDPAAPLTQPQIAKLRVLLREKQDESAALKAALVDKQRELMRVYDDFEPDMQRIAKVHEEIIALQRKLLENHHAVQMSVRKVVGEQKFARVKARLDYSLNKELMETRSKQASEKKKARPANPPQPPASTPTP